MTADRDGAPEAPYEAVAAHPDGQTTAARYAAVAADYGFDGVVVRTRAASDEADALADDLEIDVATGVEIDADPEEASGLVGRAREQFDVVTVLGGSPDRNRFAVESDRVDVLAAPMRADGDLNHVLVRAARDHDTRIEVNLGPVLRTAGGERVRRLQRLRKLRELVDYYDAPVVVSARPASHLQLRAPRELVAVGETVGFEPATVRAGLAEWGVIAAESRRRRSDSFISPGVQRVECEEDDQ
ncbi:RNase P subunit p30 family protein [Halobaculum sp. MBLA0143]|uniref:RNase P subunit p30 family protein n=1 Tax=Halobaculum sp. MBLA0143 TaxID=3079933 RepID=UPI003525B942